MKTRQEIYTEWLTALRSGEYKQTTKTLRTEDGFCCLGVLCEQYVAYGMATSKGQGERYEYNFPLGGERFHSAYSWLPISVKDFLGLTGTTESALAQMNDHGKSFNEIADFIETEIMPKVLK